MIDEGKADGMSYVEEIDRLEAEVGRLREVAEHLLAENEVEANEVHHVRAALARVQAETWAVAATTLSDHADTWEQDGGDPCRVRVCRDMARAFRTYAEGVGTPAMQTLRKKRDEARKERDEARAALDRVRALADKIAATPNSGGILLCSEVLAAIDGTDPRPEDPR